MLGKIENKVINIIRAKLEIHTSFDRQSLMLTTSAVFDGYEVHTTRLCLDELVDEILRQARVQCLEGSPAGANVPGAPSCGL